jgi:hypothetical protein
MYVQIRAIPAEGFDKRYGAGRPFTREPTTLEVVELKIEKVKLPGSETDISQAVKEALANERAVEDAHKKLGPDQISTLQLAEIKADERLVVIENVAPPPPPPKSEAEQLRERVALLEKQAAKKA